VRALTLVDRFGAEALTWVERPAPEPACGEVVVRIDALALNYRDVQVIEGVRSLKLPLIPLSDAAGVVTAVGDGVTRFAVGDRVMPAFVQGWIAGPHPQIDPLPTLGGPLDGVCRGFAAWREEGLVKVPAALSDIEAATLPCAGVSAWNALFEATVLRPGATVLIQGTGGVSLFALQFAKLAGARSILISSSDEKIERAKALGADETINYRKEPAWGKAAHRLAGDGVDVVVEVGGETTLPHSIRALRNGGHISYVGFLSGTAPQFDLGELSRKSLRITGIRVGNRQSFERMCSAVTVSGLRPVIDSIFSLDRIGDALARLKAGAHFGKIALTQHGAG
jgi:NADPH:quinone reductase-like Zn-dependent oxidoreductase